MSTSPEPQKKELSSTYFVQDRSNQNELTRVMLQDQLLTIGMGGVLSEQTNPTQWKHVLDVGCGTGYWLVEAAKTYPNLTTLTGVDISKTMVEYARSRAEEQHVSDRVQFQVMDATRMLEFPDSSFDLVNLRFSSSYLRKWDWMRILGEFRRVIKNRGVARITEPDMVESNSPGLDALQQILIQAFYQAGNTFVPQVDGITSELVRLLTQSGFKNIQSKAYVIHYQAGTEEWKLLFEDLRHAFHNLLPFFKKWTRVPDNYEDIYQQALHEMQQPDFTANWPLLTVWGSKS